MTAEDNLRGLNYTMLSSLLYKQIELETLQTAIEITEASSSYFDMETKVTDELLNAMETALKGQQISQLQAEFTSTFLLPTGVRPYESVYRGEKFQLKQEPWLKVKKFYLDCGFKLDPSSRLLEDHVSAELIFMSHLIEQKEHDLQCEFYRDHINQWVPQLLVDAKDKTTSCFYTKLIDYAVAFLEVERRKFKLQECNLNIKEGVN
ncbi:molecular chaperone TorD family protein [Proteinivorax hydrogeniformans]|uniref:Molecular chaperone TorD family protein n=1 Tax=Proteinivorax hydrogeniformans TaxID=1826727 RepID=A0AAU8HXF9_9FIRM